MDSVEFKDIFKRRFYFFMQSDPVAKVYMSGAPELVIVLGVDLNSNDLAVIETKYHRLMSDYPTYKIRVLNKTNHWEADNSTELLLCKEEFRYVN